MVTLTKFNIGDTAFIVRSKIRTYRTYCMTCKGTGSVHIQETGDTVDCPKCHGLGYHSNIEETYTKEEVIVEKIMIELDRYGTTTTIMVKIDGFDAYIDESMVFTSDEADDIIQGKKAHEYKITPSRISSEPIFRTDTVDVKL